MFSSALSTSLDQHRATATIYHNSYMGLGFRGVAADVFRTLNMGEDEGRIDVLAASLADAANESFGSNHIGYHHLDCRICNLTARSMKRTYVDRVIYHETRIGYKFTMDAFVVSHRSDRGTKYAYTYIVLY